MLPHAVASRSSDRWSQTWSEASVQMAMAVLDTALTPLSDMRASADYRRMVARNLLFKFYLETATPAARTRLEAAA